MHDSLPGWPKSDSVSLGARPGDPAYEATRDLETRAIACAIGKLDLRLEAIETSLLENTTITLQNSAAIEANRGLMAELTAGRRAVLSVGRATAWIARNGSKAIPAAAATLAAVVYLWDRYLTLWGGP